MSEQNNQEQLKAVLKKYLNNEASVQEQEAIDSWYGSVGTENMDPPVLADASAKAELYGKIKHHLSQQVPAKRFPWLRSVPVRYAAACLLILAAGLTYFYTSPSGQAGRQEIVLISGSKALKKVTLPDGTEVLLNVGSRLVIAKDFAESTRKVNLAGEAFFNVAKDKNKPFIIQSGALSTLVLGTSFNISAYPDLERIKVAVLSGKVKVSGRVNGKQQLLAKGMTRGATLSFYKSTQLTELKTEDTDLISSWRDNKLYIDNATIEDIARQLERYYHVKVVRTGLTGLKDRYTIRFNKESMTGVLQILSMLTRRSFIYQNHQIIIK